MDPRQLQLLYQHRFDKGVLRRKNQIWEILTRHFFSDFVTTEDRVLDLACGYGEFINNVPCLTRYGVDLNPDTPSFLDEGVNFVNSSATDFATKLTEPVDVVFTSNFLEHLSGKKELDEVLAQIHRALAVGGRLLILGPNLRYLPGAYWDFYDHHLGLTHTSLVEALYLSGFKPEVVIPRFLPYTTQGALPTHPTLVHLYLKVPLAWRVLGKQFFVVAKKSEWQSD
ncbi:class I SAM-dependent methyltransferase [Gammaproteobacteria bacterium]|nr:class I SAM-dependent methyltransferase [Gammaproteobacteria bacterium]